MLALALLVLRFFVLRSSQFASNLRADVGILTASLINKDLLGISSSGHISPGLNRKILRLAVLVFRFSSIAPKKSDRNLSAE